MYLPGSGPLISEGVNTIHRNLICTDTYLHVIFTPHTALHTSSQILEHYASLLGESDKSKFLHQQGAFSFPCSICRPTVTTRAPCRCGNETGPINRPGSWEWSIVELGGCGGPAGGCRCLEDDRIRLLSQPGGPRMEDTRTAATPSSSELNLCFIKLKDAQLNCSGY